MQAATRTVARSGRRLRLQIQRQPRRHASDSHGHTYESPGQAAHASNPPPANESYGSGFYIAIAAIPVSLAIYKFTGQGTNDQPYFTRLIRETYDSYKNKWADRNDFHTQAVEQAAADRTLFLNETARTVRQVDLRYPEQFNHGSPFNVPAGHGSANIDELIAKYQKEAYEQNEQKLQQLRENKVPVEQPFKRFKKVAPAAADSGS